MSLGDRRAGWSRPCFRTLMPTLATLLLTSGSAAAVGLDGPADSDDRRGAGIGLGWDQAGGIGHDGYPTIELFGHGERRMWRWLSLGGGASLARGLADRDFALSRWRGGSTSFAAVLAIGYDGPGFHFSLGPALVADNRGVDHLRFGLLPLGTVRMRIGQLDRWHGSVQLLQAIPVATGGGPIGLRFELGAPPCDQHRRRGGLYFSAAEATFGLTASDEWPAWWRGPRILAAVRTVRAGCAVGTNVGHLARIELTCTGGVLF